MSHDDPSVVKYIITSDEYERLKHFEVKCQELFEEIKQIKSNSNQVGKGDYYVINNDSSSETPALKVLPNEDHPLINFSVPLIKNDENDNFDEESLLHLVPSQHVNNARALLNALKQRGNELTWNTFGIVFIDLVAIPNSDVYFLFPYLFHKKFPVKKIDGLVEVFTKLKDMGLERYFILNQDQKSEPPLDNLTGNGVTTTIKADVDEMVESTESEMPWYYIGL